MFPANVAVSCALLMMMAIVLAIGKARGYAALFGGTAMLIWFAAQTLMFFGVHRE